MGSINMGIQLVFEVFIDAMHLTVFSRFAVWCAECAIWIICGVGDIRGEILSDLEVRKNWLSESNTLVRGVNEFLSLLPTYEGRSEINASYFIMLAHDVRGEYC